VFQVTELTLCYLFAAIAMLAARAVQLALSAG
jgi:hypothetical protein